MYVKRFVNFFFKLLKSPNNKKLIITRIKTCPILILIKRYFYVFRPIVQLVERAAHDGFVVGSNPARPISYIKYYFYMDFNSKDYQSIKLKKFFKTNDFFFLFHSGKLNLNQWIQTEQNLKKLKLKYFKILNGPTLKLFKSSIYQNLSPVICSFIIFIHSNFKTTKLQLRSVKKNLKPSFELISIKLNNKIYSTSQLKGLNSFSYRETKLT